MIKLTSISKHYMDGQKVISAVNDVSLQFDGAQLVTISGASGSGKTTLINILSGIDYATSGDYYINGVNTDTFSEEDWSNFRADNIAFVYQDFQLIEQYTVRQNIESVLALSLSSKRKRKARIKEVLRETGLLDIADKKTYKLSGGQKQRVSIARALAKNTPILLADEPTANLDTDNAKAVVELLHRAAQDRLVIVVTHDNGAFEHVVDRQIVLSDGKVVADNVVNKENLPTVSKTIENTKGNAQKEKVCKYGIGKYLKPLWTVFIIMFVVIFATLGLYSVCVDATTGTKVTDIETEYFKTITRDRYIVTTLEHLPFTDEQLQQIRNTVNVKTVVAQDIVLDNVAYMESEYLDDAIELNILPISLLKGDNSDYKWDEIVLGSTNGIPYAGLEVTGQYTTMYTSHNIIHSVKIAEYVKSEYATVYVSDEMIEIFYLEMFSQYTTNQLLSQGDNISVTNIYCDKSVPQGTIVVPSENLLGNKFDVKIKSKYAEYELKDLQSKALKDYHDLAEKYSDLSDFVLLNYDDYKQLVMSNYYQISVFSDSTLSLEQPFNVFYPYAYFNDIDKSDYLAVMLVWLAGSVLLGVALLFTSYAFLRKALKGEINLLITRRQLGYDNKDTLFYILCRLLSVFIVVVILLGSIYFVLDYVAKQPYTNNTFVILSNVSFAQLILITILLGGGYTALLTRYLYINSLTNTALLRRKRND